MPTSMGPALEAKLVQIFSNQAASAQSQASAIAKAVDDHIKTVLAATTVIAPPGTGGGPCIVTPP